MPEKAFRKLQFTLVLIFLFLSLASLGYSDSLTHLEQRDGDPALAELAVQEAAELQRLRGPYSRFQWNHPGPLLYYWLAPFYSLFGAPIGLQMAAYILKAGLLALGLLGLIHLRESSAILVLFLIQLFVVLSPEGYRPYHFGPYMLHNLYNSWNPVMAWFSYLALWCFCWLYLEGQMRALLPMVFLASLAIQSNMAVAFNAALTLLLTIAFHRRSRKELLKNSRWLWPSLILLLGLSGPTLLLEIQTGGENLRNILEHAASAGRGNASSSLFLAKVYFGPVALLTDPSESARSFTDQFSYLMVAIFLIQIATSLLAGWKCRSLPGGHRRMLMLAPLCSLASLWLVSSFPTPVLDYSVDWIMAQSILWHTVFLSSVWILVRKYFRNRFPLFALKSFSVIPGRAIALAVLSVFILSVPSRAASDGKEMVDYLQHPNPSRPIYESIQASLNSSYSSTPLSSSETRGKGILIVYPRDMDRLTYTGLVYRLHQRGHYVCVDRKMHSFFGERFRRRYSCRCTVTLQGPQYRKVELHCN